MDAFCFPAFNQQIALLLGACAQNDGIKLFFQLICRYVNADFGICHKIYTFLRQKLNTAFNDIFLKLHARNAVHQQAAGSVGTLIDCYGMTGLIQLISACQTCRA